MKLSSKQLMLFCITGFLIMGGISCGSSGGGDDSSNENTTTIQGTLRHASPTARLKEVGAGIAGVSVSALGSENTTDEAGSFVLHADGTAFSGGTVEFTFNSPDINETVLLEGVMGGPGVTAYTDFVLEQNGKISGESKDVDGNVLGTTPGAKVGCEQLGTFSDGGGGALWKPHSERTGTVVVLMPAEYRFADVAILNSSGDSVASPVIRDCCDHNGGREHIYLSASAGSLPANVTVRFTFSDGRVDCRAVPNPTQRYD